LKVQSSFIQSESHSRPERSHAFSGAAEKYAPCEYVELIFNFGLDVKLQTYHVIENILNRYNQDSSAINFGN
jgi:hypothetical protein